MENNGNQQKTWIVFCCPLSESLPQYIKRVQQYATNILVIYCAIQGRLQPSGFAIIWTLCKNSANDLAAACDTTHPCTNTHLYLTMPFQSNWVASLSKTRGRRTDGRTCYTSPPPPIIESYDDVRDGKYKPTMMSDDPRRRSLRRDRQSRGSSRASLSGGLAEQARLCAVQ
jgi:hypothetical protein